MLAVCHLTYVSRVYLNVYVEVAQVKYELAEYDVFVSVPAKVFNGERIIHPTTRKRA